MMYLVVGTLRGRGLRVIEVGWSLETIRGDIMERWEAIEIQQSHNGDLHDSMPT